MCGWVNVNNCSQNDVERVEPMCAEGNANVNSPPLADDCRAYVCGG